MEKLKVMVVDDSVVYRKVISEAVEATGLANVKKVASNGTIALEWLRRKEFDLVLLDVFMPELDGIQTLEIIKEKYPDIEVIMISSKGRDSAELIVEALDKGAIEFIVKPVEKEYNINFIKIKNMLNTLFAQININKYSAKRDRVSKKVDDFKEKKDLKKPSNLDLKKENKKIEEKYKKNWRGPQVILIASSTGGPVALERIITKLPPDFNKPILIVQHMPPDFTKILAESLNRKARLQVSEAEAGETVLNGKVLISPGGRHMVVYKKGHFDEKIIRLKDSPHVHGVRPAADVLFNSIANAYENKKVLAVILTGMGNDGRDGVAELKKRCDCYCITQSEKTCVVYGMPRSVYEAGLSDEVVDLENIADRIEQIMFNRGE